MFKTYFGDIHDGRLMRLQYLGYSILLSAIAFGIMLMIVLAVGAGEHLIGGDLQQAQDKLRGWFSLPAIALFGLVYLGLAFAGANIMAKRIRDIGLPGWWMVLLIFLITGGATAAGSEQSGSGLYSLIWIALLLIPGGAFARGK